MQKEFAEIVVAGHWDSGKKKTHKNNKTKGDINKDQEQSILTMLKHKGCRGGHSLFKRKSKDIFYSRI